MGRFLLYALAFGPPRPLHRMLLANWAACEMVDFVLLTDCEDAWRSKMAEGSRVSVVATTLPTYFSLGARALGHSSAELMALHGDKLFGRQDGWTACGLRALLPLMYPVEGTSARYTHRGWIDNDVLLDAQMLRRHLFRYADRALLMFTEAGMLFEQVKLLHRDVDLLPVYQQLLRAPFSGMPLEAACVYHLRGLPELTRDMLPSSLIAVHWLFTDTREEGAPFRKHVIVGPDWTLREVTTSERLLMMVADSEIKYTQGEHMSLMYHVHADVMRQAQLASLQH